jgi:hypothetical protein
LNILTKICIVVLVVLILLSIPVFLSMAVNVDNYRQFHEQEVARNKALAAENGLIKDELRVQKDQTAAAQDLANRYKADLDAERTERAKVLAALADNDRTILAAFQKVDARDDEFLVARKFFERRTQDFWDENKQLRTERTQLAAEKADLQDQLNQQKALYARQQGENMTLKEQLQDRDQQIAELNQRIAELQNELITGGTGTGVAAAPTGVPGAATTVIGPDGRILVEGETAAARITGTVIAVKDDLASIDVGSAQGVKSGMKMLIYRGAQMIGYLQIEVVDAGESAGIVKDKQYEPQKGDQVAWPLPRTD